MIEKVKGRSQRRFVFCTGLLAIVAMIFLYRALSHGHENKDAGESYIYVTMLNNDWPRLDYEGEGMKISSGTSKRGNTQGDVFDCDLIAIKIPEGATYVMGGKYDAPSNYVVQFTAVIERTGTNGIHVNGTVSSKISGKVQFAEMMEKNEKGTNHFPEIPFGSGKTAIDFSGRVTAWLEK